MVSTDAELVERLRAGEELAFVELIDRYHGRLVALARQFVDSREAAEDVVQETWVALIRGVERFEGRSSLRTWLFQICVNRGRSIGVRERKFHRFGRSEPAVDPSRFGDDGAWSDPPQHWADTVDDRLAADALATHIRTAIGKLPTSQRLVVTLRDVDGLTSEEVCAVLSVSEANQRVLLHRGRSAVRRMLDAVMTS